METEMESGMVGTWKLKLRQKLEEELETYI